MPPIEVPLASIHAHALQLARDYPDTIYNPGSHTCHYTAGNTPSGRGCLIGQAIVKAAVTPHVINVLRPLFVADSRNLDFRSLFDWLLTPANEQGFVISLRGLDVDTARHMLMEICVAQDRQDGHMPWRACFDKRTKRQPLVLRDIDIQRLNKRILAFVNWAADQ